MTKVTMTFRFPGSSDEAVEYLKSQLPAWGSDAVSDFIDGSETWTVDGRDVKIIEGGDDGDPA